MIEPNSAHLRYLIKSAKPKYLLANKEFKPGETLIPFNGPSWGHEELEASIKTLFSGDSVSSGMEVVKFQQAYCRMFGTRHSHMVNSSTAANYILLASLKKWFKWKDGDEVIVNSMELASALAQNRLNPVFVGIETKTLNMDLNIVERSITQRTKAIFVKTAFGNPPDMSRLQKMAYDYKIHILGDCEEALGTKWGSEHLGCQYYAWTTSFARHHLVIGEGGMISSNDEELIQVCEAMSEGFRPLDLQGSIGLVQLGKFQTLDKQSRDNFQTISGFVKNMVEVHQAASPSWIGVPLLFHDIDSKHKFQYYLEANKIQTSNFYGNINVMSIGCAPFYTSPMLSYIEQIIKAYK